MSDFVINTGHAKWEGPVQLNRGWLDIARFEINDLNQSPCFEFDWLADSVA